MVGIAGFGYVGKAYYKIFNDAVIYDPFVKREDFPDVKFADKDELNKCDMVLVCVPTPTSVDGKTCDTSIVEGIFEWLTVPLVLIKSTIKPGTTAKLQEKYAGDIVFSPEFVGEGGYFVPFWQYPHKNNPQYHDFQILGGKKEATNKLASLFIRRVGPHIRIYQTDSKTAEVIKYTENMFIATKVTFVNEMYEVCKALGVTWNDVREGWLLDTRVSRMFSGVFDDKRGYEGKCLPKDTKALVASSEQAGYTPSFLKEVLASNDRLRILNGFDKV